MSAAFFLLILVAVNVHWQVSFRFARVLGLLILALLLTTPSHQMAGAFFFGSLGMLVPLGVFGLRAMIAEACGELGKGRVRLVDHIIWFAVGGLIAGTLFRILGSDLAGASNAIAPHVVISVLALGCAIMAVALPSGWNAIGAGFGVALLTLTLLSGLWFPKLVVDRAVAMAGNAPFTLTLAGQPPDTFTAANLTFLTMPKEDWGPHAILSFETVAGRCNAAWSYTFLNFRTDNWMIDSSACPR